MTVQCCKCKKIRVEDEWIRHTHDLKDDVSHGYCPICFGELIDELVTDSEISPHSRLASLHIA